MPQRSAKLRVTTRDVAARAGVSQPTVSLVLSRSAHARVAPETRERVLKAAAELGYRPNVLLRGLNVVLIDERPGGRWPGVVPDAAGAGRLAAEPLIALGHRRVAFI